MTRPTILCYLQTPDSKQYKVK